MKSKPLEYTATAGELKRNSSQRQILVYICFPRKFGAKKDINSHLMLTTSQRHLLEVRFAARTGGGVFFCVQIEASKMRCVLFDVIKKHFLLGAAAYQLGNTSSRIITEVNQC